MSLQRNLTWDQACPLWAAALDPVLANLLVQGGQLRNIVLVASTPQTLNHYLGKTQTGMIVTYQNAAASIYVPQPFNSTTITLESSANVTCSIWCF